jgi:hypothetical protein
MVVTETDHLDFLIYMVKNWQALLPAVVRIALSGAALLFVGYSLVDWDFRMLLRGIISSHEASLNYPVAIQLRPDILNEKDLDKAPKYLDKCIGRTKIPKVKVYWGTAREFSRELIWGINYVKTVPTICRSSSPSKQFPRSCFLLWKRP